MEIESKVYFLYTHLINIGLYMIKCRKKEICVFTYYEPSFKKLPLDLKFDSKCYSTLHSSTCILCLLRGWGTHTNSRRINEDFIEALVKLWLSMRSVCLLYISDENWALSFLTLYLLNMVLSSCSTVKCVSRAKTEIFKILRDVQSRF